MLWRGFVGLSRWSYDSWTISFYPVSGSSFYCVPVGGKGPHGLWKLPGSHYRRTSSPSGPLSDGLFPSTGMDDSPAISSFRTELGSFPPHTAHTTPLLASRPPTRNWGLPPNFGRTNNSRVNTLNQNLSSRIVIKIEKS